MQEIIDTTNRNRREIARALENFKTQPRDFTKILYSLDLNRKAETAISTTYRVCLDVISLFPIRVKIESNLVDAIETLINNGQGHSYDLVVTDYFVEEMMEWPKPTNLGGYLLALVSKAYYVGKLGEPVIKIYTGASGVKETLDKDYVEKALYKLGALGTIAKKKKENLFGDFKTFLHDVAKKYISNARRKDVLDFQRCLAEKAFAQAYEESDLNRLAKCFFHIEGSQDVKSVRDLFPHLYASLVTYVTRKSDRSLMDKFKKELDKVKELISDGLTGYRADLLKDFYHDKNFHNLIWHACDHEDEQYIHNHLSEITNSVGILLADAEKQGWKYKPILQDLQDTGVFESIREYQEYIKGNNTFGTARQAINAVKSKLRISSHLEENYGHANYIVASSFVNTLCVTRSEKRCRCYVPVGYLKEALKTLQTKIKEKGKGLEKVEVVVEDRLIRIRLHQGLKNLNSTGVSKLSTMIKDHGIYEWLHGYCDLLFVIQQSSSNIFAYDLFNNMEDQRKYPRLDGGYFELIFYNNENE